MDNVIKDDNLKIMLNNLYFKRDINTDITVSDMESLTGALNLNFMNITDLEGMQYAENIEQLYIGNNSIADVSYLGSLINLKWLQANDNLISNLIPIVGGTNSDGIVYEGLSNLKGLDLSRNPIVLLPQFNRLNKLEVLRLNDVSGVLGYFDLIKLSGLEILRCLDVSGNDIEDIEFIPNILNIQSLNLGSNRIQNINILESLEKIKILCLNDNKIQDISSLKNLREIITLDLRNNYIFDLEPLKSDIAIEQIYLDNNKIKKIYPISQLGKLILLSLSGNEISDLMSLPIINDKGSLFIDNMGISDIGFLSKNKNIRSLSLNNNKLVDINIVGQLHQLEVLSLQYNNVRDISAISNLDQLFVLNLDNNSIADITYMSNISDVSSVSTVNNQNIILPQNVIEVGNSLDVVKYIKDVNGTVPARITNILPSSDENKYENGKVIWGKITEDDVLRFDFWNGSFNGEEWIESFFLGNVIIGDIVSIPDMNLKKSLNYILNQILIGGKAPEDSDITENELKALKLVNLKDKSINNLEGIQYAINITNLDISNNNINDISKLSTMGKIISLNINDNSITDLTPILSFTNLQPFVSLGQRVRCEEKRIDRNGKVIISLDSFSGANKRIIDINFSAGGHVIGNSIVWTNITSNTELWVKCTEIYNDGIFNSDLMFTNEITRFYPIIFNPTRGIQLF